MNDTCRFCSWQREKKAKSDICVWMRLKLALLNTQKIIFMSIVCIFIFEYHFKFWIKVFMTHSFKRILDLKLSKNSIRLESVSSFILWYIDFYIIRSLYFLVHYLDIPDVSWQSQLTNILSSFHLLEREKEWTT